MFRSNDQDPEKECRGVRAGSSWRLVTSWVVALGVAVVIMMFLRHSPNGIEMQDPVEPRTDYEQTCSQSFVEETCDYDIASRENNVRLVPDTQTFSEAHEAYPAARDGSGTVMASSGMIALERHEDDWGT